MDKKLDCCVVRDLLPAYIEDLTEEGTTVQVKEHLEDCEACRAVEAGMRAQVPVEKAPTRALNFLKRVKRTRLLAAAVTLALTLWCMWWLYDAEFHYPNTEAGRLAAVEDYIPGETGSVRYGTEVHCVAYQELDNRLLIFYKADNANNVYGILELERGFNGKYAAVRASYDPSAFCLGLYGERLRVDKTEYLWLGGYNCRDVYSAQVEYVGHNFEGTERQYAARTYACSKTDFLWLWEYESVIRELGWEPGLEDGQVCWLSIGEIRLLDRDGNDITERYRDESVTQSWGGGKGTAEQFLLYWYIGIVAVLGVTLIQYFLRRD